MMVEVAGSPVGWLFAVGAQLQPGQQRAYPLMDFVTDDGPEWLHAETNNLAPLCTGEDGSSGTPCLDASDGRRLLEKMTSTHLPSRTEAASALLDIDWFSLVTHQGEELWQENSSFANALSGSDLDISEACDGLSTDDDRNYIQRVRASLGGIETFPLEQNEFKWAEFFARATYKGTFCMFGPATLFLVAGDVLAYAAGAAAGDPKKFVQRALQWAQVITRHYILSRGEYQDGTGKRGLVGVHELATTSWPVWPLLQSIAVELKKGRRASHFTTSVPALKGRLAALSRPFPSPYENPLGDGELYLSIIIQCRNDDYGVGMMSRLNRMLISSTYMLHEAGVAAEIIIVEWNPPVSTGPLADLLARAPGTEGTIPIRVITVPTSVHMSLPHHKAHPIFEHIAENVGFRRARGRFVLKTNIDNILSPNVIKLIAEKRLREDSVYRATYLEYDVDPAIDSLSPGDMLGWLFGQGSLQQSALQKSSELSKTYPEDSVVCSSASDADKAGSWRSNPNGPPSVATRPFYWPGSGDFVLTSMALINYVHGYPQIAQNWQTDDLIHCRLRAAGVRQVVLQPPCVTVHQNHQRINRIRAGTRWVVTDSTFQSVCQSPFDILPTETGLEDDWGFPNEDFLETLV